MDYALLDLESFRNKESFLVACQKGKNCPFEIKRVFYIFNVKKDAIRGQHANRETKFLMIALSGSCHIKIDNGIKQKIIVLNNPKQGLYVGKMLWKEMYNFSKDSILLVMANTLYNESEYISDYQLYQNIMKNGGGGVVFNYVAPAA